MKKWAKEEDEKYSLLYKNNYPIGAPMRLIKLFNIDKNKKCIDLGCGRASLSKYFSKYTGIDVSAFIVKQNQSTRTGLFLHQSLDNLYEITEAYDVAICSDVMEHIPEDEIHNVLKSISSLNVQNYYFAISTRKSVFLDMNGNNLHLSVLTASEWINHLSNYFKVIEKEIKPTLLSVTCIALPSNI